MVVDGKEQKTKEVGVKIKASRCCRWRLVGDKNDIFIPMQNVMGYKKWTV